MGRLFGQGNPVEYNFTALLNAVTDVRKNSGCICIVPRPTAGNWLGINTASRQLFGASVFDIPQHYSNQVLTDDEIIQLVRHIEELGFDSVIFSGFPAYFEKVVNAFSAGFARKIGVVLHGTFTEMGNSPAAANAMMTPINLRRKNKIGKLAAVRKSVAEFITANWKVPVFELANKCSIDGLVLPDKPMQSVNIGVMGAGTFNKNLHNQVAAALLVKNAFVHVSKGVGFEYLDTQFIVEHPRLDRAAFIGLLSQMDVNMHLSFSESWGQVAAESMLTGVPCLVSPNTNLLDDDSFLKAELTVNRTDAPLEIAERINSVLAKRTEISVRGKAYIQQLNTKADVLLTEFLNS